MKQIYFFLTALFLVQFCSFAQPNKNIPVKVFTKSEDILKDIMQSHNPKKKSDTKRTVVTTKALPNGYVMESKIGQYWSAEDTNWVNSSKELDTYNPEGLQTVQIDQMWNNGQWENSRRYLTTYYFEDLVSLLEEQTWSGSAWGNSYNYVSTYNSNHQLTEKNVLHWNNAAFDSMYKTIYTYNSGNLETRIEQTWNGTSWDNNYRYTFQYNTNNDVSERLEEIWFDSKWANSLLNVYTYNTLNQLELDASFWWPDTAWKESVDLIYGYDSFGNINDRITKFWESEVLGLQNKYHTAYEFLPNSSLETKAESQEWNLASSVWVNTTRNISTYTTENKLEKYLSEGWDANTSTWIIGFQENSSYDENGNLDTLLAQYWDGTQWINTFRTAYNWAFVVSVEDEGSLPSTYSLEQNYPNPFNPSTRILFNLASDANVSLTLYDILGNEITRLIDGNLSAGKHEVQLNAGQLTSGVYFYRLNATDSQNKTSFSSVRKMLLLK